MGAHLDEHGPLARGTFAVVVLVSLAVLFAPGSAVPSAPAGTDKVVHATLFLALGFSGRWAGIPRGVLAGALPLYAAVSELLQAIPALHRDATLGDWAADVLGALLGLLLWEIVGRRAA